MTAALKREADNDRQKALDQKVVPLHPQGRDRPSPHSASRSARLRGIASPNQGQSLAGTNVQPLPTAPSLPLWLRVLMHAQKGSSVVMLASVAAMLVVYGWTVQIQSSWGREYQKLQALLQQERQLTTSTEALKQTIAEIAEDPTVQMALPAPTQMLFLEPAPPREPRVVEERPPILRSPRNAPIGY